MTKQRRSKRRGYCDCYLCLPGHEKKYLLAERIAQREIAHVKARAQGYLRSVDVLDSLDEVC